MTIDLLVTGFKEDWGALREHVFLHRGLTTLSDGTVAFDPEQ